jgi:3-oxoacid CoA-transferase subunit A
MVSEGGLPWRYAADGSVLIQSPKKETRMFGSLGEEQEYVLEEAIVTDFSIVRAKVGDTQGNLVFEKSARNFNPPAAMAGRITIAEVDRLVPAGTIDPDDVHLPGIYVHRIVELSAKDAADLPIEKTTTRPRPSQGA